ncbi:hypothetical protein D4764_12G0009670 [Takifugu flavidus]|uniref:Uncharacterized protein n=1 Tax=Takifugu flavidus TaxID=433684 RepID=A0A5C6PGQ8_9TELE|nr:hypothetical protein D4764_12G0009670 [Takifugu flavidus]
MSKQVLEVPVEECNGETQTDGGEEEGESGQEEEGEAADEEAPADEDEELEETDEQAQAEEDEQQDEEADDDRDEEDLHSEVTSVSVINSWGVCCMDVCELISMVITAHQLHGNMSNKHSSLYSNFNVSMFVIYRRKKRLKHKREKKKRQKKNRSY